MTDSASSSQSDILDQRLRGGEADLHITMATSSFPSALEEWALSPASESDSTTTWLESVEGFIGSKSYAKVPISVLPGTGHNFVHQLGPNPRENPPNRLCAATARLLPLQTLLELPLAILGIRLQKELGDSQQPYLWPHRAKVNDIEVVRIPQNCTDTFTSKPTQLSSADLSRSVWDFVQPERNMTVIIHLKAVSTQPRPSTHRRLQPLIDQNWPQGRKRDKANTSNPPPPLRHSEFRDEVRPECCVITRSSDLLEVSHIIPRTLNHKSVTKVMELLFGALSPFPDETPIPALFHHRKEGIHEGPDDPRNGMFLSIAMHKVFDIRRTIWILWRRCYLLGPPVCFEELSAFDPPCPSTSKIRKIRTEAEELELWKEQLSHEEVVKPPRCPDLTDIKVCLLHLSALLSFFDLFMLNQEAMKAALVNLRKGWCDDRRSDLDDRPGSNKKQKTGTTETNGEAVRQERTGPPAAGGSGGGSASGLHDQQQPERSSYTSEKGLFSRDRPTSPPPSNPPSSEGSPSYKQGRVNDNIAAPKTMESRLTPPNSEDETETGSDLDSDSKSHRGQESDWDEDEERRKEILRSNTLALSFITHAFNSEIGQLCV